MPAAAIAIFANRRDRRIKSPISGMSDIGDRHSPSEPVPSIFYGHCCESPVKSTHQVGRFYHDFSKLLQRRDRRKISRQVCLHQSVTKIADDFRWRSNSPQSAYKIARCVAGFSHSSERIDDSRANARNVSSFTVAKLPYQLC